MTGTRTYFVFFAFCQTLITSPRKIYNTPHSYHALPAHNPDRPAGLLLFHHGQCHLRGNDTCGHSDNSITHQHNGACNKFTKWRYQAGYLSKISGIPKTVIFLIVIVSLRIICENCGSNPASISKAAFALFFLSYIQMPKYLHIHVPDPCQQSWEQMKYDAAGRFCDHCRKTVIDFTGYTDNQLLEYFQQHSSDVCGRFYSEQLEQALPLPEKKIPWLQYFFRVAIPAMLFSYKSQAQKLLKKNNEPIVMTEKKPMLPKVRTFITVTGNIIGLAGIPLAGASVMIKGTATGVAADSNGLFSLRVGAGEQWLEVSCVGYETKQVFITAGMLRVQLDVPLGNNVVVESSTMIKGKTSVVAGGVMRLVSRELRVVKEQPAKEAASIPAAVTLFPNPAHTGSPLTIQWKKPVTHNQQLALYNASGSKLLEQTLSIKQPTLQTTFRPGNHPAGYYILLITDITTQQKHSVVFMIQ